MRSRLVSYAAPLCSSSQCGQHTWLRVLNRSGGTDLRQTLPHGRGSVSVCKHEAFRSEPRPYGSVCHDSAAKPSLRLSTLAPAHSPSVYRSRCGSFAAPTDSAIWKVVTSPSRLSYRPPGSVLESRCGSLSRVLKADLPNWLTTEAVRCCQGKMVRFLVTQSAAYAVQALAGATAPILWRCRTRFFSALPGSSVGTG